MRVCDFNKEVKLFMIFDILGDTIRTGMLLWKIDRERLEDVKNHVFDLLTIARLLKDKFPDCLNYEKMYDYILCHDLPEAITGDITKFEGVSDIERREVTDIAIDYLIENFGDILNFKNILESYENRIDLESKVVHMIDKVHSASTFIKYECEKHIDFNNDIIKELRYHPFVDEKIKKGKDVADIFYEFHLKSVEISDEECVKYGVSRCDADRIVHSIRGFAEELYRMKLNGTLFEFKNDFPKEGMKYNRKK